MERFRGLLKKMDKKALNNVFLALAVGVALLAGAMLFGRGGEPAPKAAEATREEAAAVNTDSRERELERRLEETLGFVAGAGKVRVMLTMGLGDEETVAAVNETAKKTATDERDAEGGSRSVAGADTQTSYVLMKQKDGSEAPLVLKTAAATVLGVVIVAEGGDDAAVKDRLTRAAYTALGLPPHRVQVVKMGK